jgi:hypothetical protein
VSHLELCSGATARCSPDVAVFVEITFILTSVTDPPPYCQDDTNPAGADKITCAVQGTFLLKWCVRVMHVSVICPCLSVSLYMCLLGECLV